MGNIIGFCRFCGQMITPMLKGLTQEEADEIATKECECPGGKQYRDLYERIENAQERVEQLFGEDCLELGFRSAASEDTVRFLKKIVEATAHGEILAANVQLEGCGRFAIRVTSKGKIRAERAEARVYQLEE